MSQRTRILSLICMDITSPNVKFYISGSKSSRAHTKSLETKFGTINTERKDKCHLRPPGEIPWLPGHRRGVLPNEKRIDQLRIEQIPYCLSISVRICDICASAFEEPLDLDCLQRSISFSGKQQNGQPIAIYTSRS